MAKLPPAAVPEDHRTRASFGFHVWRGRPSAMTAAHRHGDVEFNFVVRGRMRYFLGGRFQQIPEGRLGGMWAGLPHRLVETERGTECIWITLPLAWFLAWNLPGPFTRRLLAGELMVEPDASRSAEDRRQHERWIDDLESGESERRRLAVLEVEARVRRLALARTPAAKKARMAGGAGASSPGGEPVERMAGYIAEHFREDLSVEQIAGSAGLHPNYAMTLFKRACGMSIWAYLTRLRVSHAQLLLASSQAKVLDVALASGFGSASRFYETFSKVVGRTPKQYRRAMARN